MILSVHIFQFENKLSLLSPMISPTFINFIFFFLYLIKSQTQKNNVSSFLYFLLQAQDRILKCSILIFLVINSQQMIENLQQIDYIQFSNLELIQAIQLRPLYIDLPISHICEKTGRWNNDDFYNFEEEMHKLQELNRISISAPTQETSKGPKSYIQSSNSLKNQNRAKPKSCLRSDQFEKWQEEQKPGPFGTIHSCTLPKVSNERILVPSLFHNPTSLKSLKNLRQSFNIDSGVTQTQIDQSFTDEIIPQTISTSKKEKGKGIFLDINWPKKLSPFNSSMERSTLELNSKDDEISIAQKQTEKMK